jgi:hypothetical protein
MAYRLFLEDEESHGLLETKLQDDSILLEQE